jgi:hypothetical protein
MRFPASGGRRRSAMPAMCGTSRASMPGFSAWLEFPKNSEKNFVGVT